MSSRNHPNVSRSRASSQPESAERSHVRVRKFWLAITALTLILCGTIGFVTTLGIAFLLRPQTRSVYKIVDTNHPLYAGSPIGDNASELPLSNVFTPEVQYWATLIRAWAVLYQVDPNLIATLIQIESCGDSLVSSPAGAQGLFQVMPFHFADGEDMLDVQTNARRGMDYLLGGLELSDGHAGLALAGYNGGHGIIDRGWAGWTQETRRYYYWGARIYAEAVSGMGVSPTLQEWLNSGGANLCTLASQHQAELQQKELASAATKQ